MPVVAPDQERESKELTTPSRDHVQDLEILKERTRKDLDLLPIQEQSERSRALTPEMEETVGLVQSQGKQEPTGPSLVPDRQVIEKIPGRDREQIQSQNSRSLVLAPKMENKVIAPDQIMALTNPVQHLQNLEICRKRGQDLVVILGQR